jgi:voltage-gated potassium channel
LDQGVPRASPRSAGSALRALRDGFLRRRHTALLVAIAIAFAARPLIGEGRLAPLAFSFAFLGLMFVALYTVQVDELIGEREHLLAQRKRQSAVGFVLAAAAIIERVSALFSPSPRILVAGSIGWMAFFAFVTWSELRSVLRQKAVTSETISMSISVYLLLGLTWSFLYFVIFQMHPDAFHLGAEAPSSDTSLLLGGHLFPTFVYFSLITLSTLGYGDVTPLSLPARYAAAAESITGQFYLAILVARLVAMQVSRSGHR